MSENPNHNYDPAVEARDRDPAQPGAMKQVGEVLSPTVGRIPLFNEPHIAKKFLDFWNAELGPATGHIGMRGGVVNNYTPLNGRLRVVVDVELLEGEQAFNNSRIGALELIHEVVPS